MRDVRRAARPEPVGEELEALHQRLADNAREILRLLVNGPEDPKRLAELDARAAVLRHAVNDARPEPEDAQLSRGWGLRREDR
jgi:hypothetical protein